MDFEWDDSKNAKVRAERGFGFEEAVAIFLGRTVQWRVDRRDYGEPRVKAVGEAHGRFFTVVFTDKGSVRRIITAWPSHTKERERWRDSA